MLECLFNQMIMRIPIKTLQRESGELLEPSQNIHKCALSRSGWTHDGGQFPRVKFTAYGLQNGFVPYIGK